MDKKLPKIFDYDFKKDTDKPWNNSSNDVSDYFNYGFCE